MKLSEFDYELPEELIAQMPCDKRENSKMLILDKTNKTIEHKHFYDITDLQDTLLVLNNTKVIPARLYAEKETGAKIEIFLLKELEPQKWEVLIKPSKRVKAGQTLHVSDELAVEVLEKLDGKWLAGLLYTGNIFDVLERNGHIPLPPYIERKTENFKDLDFERYQTVYAAKEGSVAAPTAGLHFTRDILQKLESRGIETAYVTLNVGLGTFRPVKSENISEHKMESESFEISPETADAVNRAKQSGRKITCVGTTTVRTLETAFRKYGKITACRDTSELFIYPPYNFRITDSLITNFHLPKSTLLMLVSALAGKDLIFRAYEEAIANRYRFYSYGDCMFIS
ncbi:MAG: tRNA preQ1(34) S-adenosylmethionine ribosyltransferase-isomerase QueA [Heliobacteriaceae bacterium]|jgi:S-adenosylmethionine:tRNA ribosyltransferase-isomerase|nr:tRNA preQ1(34) S-adenosylmethionine ribosyltransferase-isomerase QueA [Heliobacteriaceae bacterium]